MLVSYNWLKDFLGTDAPDAYEIADLLGSHAFEIEEIDKQENDVVIDVDVLPNRSSDCLSHRGIAREIATLTGEALEKDPFSELPVLDTTDSISIEIENKEVCPRFTATLFTDIEVKESPQWLKDRLEALGQRPINNIVDATNYVMFGLGQPMHVYDADLFPQVAGVWKFGVRTANEGEEVSLLPEKRGEDARVLTLKGTETLVTDASTDTPIGLAGVKGGTFAEVHAGSKNVIVEAATWHPTITRKTARGLGIVIDASKRYENDLTSEMPIYAQAEIIELIKNIAGGTYKGFVDVHPIKREQPVVSVCPDRVNALLGLTLEVEKMTEILARAGISVAIEGDMLSCVGPWERTDLSIEADVIEEIGRIYGYDHVESVTPDIVPLKELNARHYYAEKVRNVLLNLGFSEVITSSFRKKDQIKLHNALASDKGCLRSSLLKNIAETLDKNAGFTDLLGTTDTRVFEIGTVFSKKEGGGIVEHISLALGVRLKQSGYTGKEDRLCDEILSAISKELGVAFGAVSQQGQKTVEEDGQQVTYAQGVAEVNFSEVLEKLQAPTKYDPVAVGDEIVYQPFSVYQHMTRDIALWVTEGTTADDVESVLNEHAGALRVRTTLFDEFTKDGRTSYAFRLVFQSHEKTLTDEEVNAEMEKVNVAVAGEGWEVR